VPAEELLLLLRNARENLAVKVVAASNRYIPEIQLVPDGPLLGLVHHGPHVEAPIVPGPSAGDVVVVRVGVHVPELYLPVLQVDQ
jgi:hypothetical protein